MTRDKVIELARKVKLEVAMDFDYRGSFEAMTAPEQDKLVQLEQFAALVEAHEREWVGLTDDERRYIRKKHQQHDAFARAIEAKLKEKNT